MIAIATRTAYTCGRQWRSRAGAGAARRRGKRERKTREENYDVTVPLLSSVSRQSAATTANRRHRHHQQRSDNASTCSSLDSLPPSETKHLWSELEARDRTIADLRLVITRLEPEADAARRQVAQLDMINVRISTTRVRPSP